jgi:hypothetical protein
MGGPEGVYIFSQLVEVNIPSTYNVAPVPDWESGPSGASGKTADCGFCIPFVCNLKVMGTLNGRVRGVPNWFLPGGVP